MPSGSCVMGNSVSCCRALEAQIGCRKPGLCTEAPGWRGAGTGQGNCMACFTPRQHQCACDWPGVSDGFPALLQVAVLLLYHTSVSSKNPGDCNEFDYKTQVIPLGFLLWIWGAGGSSSAFDGRCSETCPPESH